MKTYYMVLHPSTNYTRYRHESYPSAKAEAERLARQNPGQEFVVLQALATLKTNDVTVDEIDRLDDYIPF